MYRFQAKNHLANRHLPTDIYLTNITFVRHIGESGYNHDIWQKGILPTWCWVDTAMAKVNKTFDCLLWYGNNYCRKYFYGIGSRLWTIWLTDIWLTQCLSDILFGRTRYDHDIWPKGILPTRCLVDTAVAEPNKTLDWLKFFRSNVFWPKGADPPLKEVQTSRYWYSIKSDFFVDVFAIHVWVGGWLQKNLKNYLRSFSEWSKKLHSDSYIGTIFWMTKSIFEFNLNLFNTFEFHQALCTNVSINEPRLMKLVP